MIYAAIIIAVLMVALMIYLGYEAVKNHQNPTHRYTGNGFEEIPLSDEFCPECGESDYTFVHGNVVECNKCKHPYEFNYGPL